MSENYLIIGDDDYIRDREIKRIRDKYLQPGEIELNYSVCGPEDVKGAMDSLGTFPFLADKRVVLVNGTGQLSEGFIETVLSYLENPSETSVLLLSFPGAVKKDKNFRKLSGKVKLIKADKPESATIKNWINAFFKREGIEASREAVGLIVELKGHDTAGIKAELEKLASFSDGRKIEVGHVEQLMGRSVAETVFKLVDAINAKDAGWTFRILNDLYDQKKQPPEIIGYLGWYLRIMQKITLFSGKGIGMEGIAAELGYSPGYVKRLSHQAKKYPVSRIDKWVSCLLDADREIKTGLKQPRLALEMLVADFLNG